MAKAIRFFLVLLCCFVGGAAPVVAPTTQRSADIAIVVADPPHSTWPQVTFEPLPDPTGRAARDYLEIINNQISRQRADVLKHSGLAQIVVVSQLKVNGQSRAAVPDYPAGRLYLDPAVGAGHGQYQRHAFHHEFFHFIIGKWKNDAYYHDPAWIALNAPNTRYGDGGVNARTSNMFVLTHPAPGFINRYSKSAVEEDMAEIFAVQFLPQELALVESWAKKDAVLDAKLNYMRRLIDRFAFELPVHPTTRGAQ